MVFQEGRDHLFPNANGESLVEQVEVILSRQDLDHRVTSQFCQRAFETARRAFQIERILGPHKNVYFPSQLRGKLGPVHQQS